MMQTCESALLTDFYEIAMLQVYFQRGMNENAVFEFFVRQLPPQRNFLVSSGLEQVMDYLRKLRFDDDDLAWLRAGGRFDAAFLDSLREFRFTGDVDAMPEGTIFFPDEPILRVRAPLREAQFIESRLINLLHYQTLIASKAVRARIAAPRAQLIDFGMRRAHGAEAAVLSARASYLAGFDGTATTLAASLFDIPVFGTMAHSFVQVHEYETDAFSSFARAFPDNVILLIDTYDTEAAAGQVVQLARSLRQANIRIKAVRIDSGEPDATSRRVRQILDAGQCSDIGIFISSNLDEHALQALVDAAAPINGFGIGTRLNTSSDAPSLDCAYKLVEYAGRPCRKRSSGKQYWPGAKQVFRVHDAAGVVVGDTLAPQSATFPGQALLEPVMRRGTPLGSSPTLPHIRSHVCAQVAALPAGLRSLHPASPFQLVVPAEMRRLARRVDARQQLLARRDRARWIAS
ncbi:MAG TPA: nicotinate phosphoribosyltransferase [Duganella sp.]|nr:nicotinate phosphoribosyltransferase [Duganella sp.]